MEYVKSITHCKQSSVRRGIYLNGLGKYSIEVYLIPNFISFFFEEIGAAHGIRESRIVNKMAPPKSDLRCGDEASNSGKAGGCTVAIAITSKPTSSKPTYARHRKTRFESRIKKFSHDSC